MQKLIKSLYPLLPLTLNFLFIDSLCQDHTPTRFCGKIQIQSPFLSPNSTSTSPFNHMILCRSQKLYFRTSLGLFPVSSIDYGSKTLTISNPSCSSSRHYVSSSLLSAGFPSPPQPNSLLLFNCLNSRNQPVPSVKLINCSYLNPCAASSKTQDRKPEFLAHSCLLVNDLENLDKGFHPKHLNCSHYSQVYRRSLNDEDYELGARISFDIPDHVPDICSECQKTNGNCGVGLKCICHPQDCKDKVISMAARSTKSSDITLLQLLSFIVLLVSFLNS